MKSTVKSAEGKIVYQRKEGRIQKVRKQLKKEEDSAEIKAYLDKLQDIVPFMPKNKRLSKLEVISYVIEYIRNLRQTLGLPPSCANNDDSDLDLMESEPSVIAALTQAAAANSTATVAMLAVINNSAPANLLPLQEISPFCHSHHHNRQPLAAIANPTQGSR